jgi:hypothetical protein
VVVPGAQKLADGMPIAPQAATPSPQQPAGVSPQP